MSEELEPEVPEPEKQPESIEFQYTAEPLENVDTGNIKLEIGNTDLYSIGVQVKWDVNTKRFTTGTWELVDKTLEDTKLIMLNKVGYLSEEQDEAGEAYYTFTSEDGRKYLVDVSDTIFTLAQPIAVARFK